MKFVATLLCGVIVALIIQVLPQHAGPRFGSADVLGGVIGQVWSKYRIEGAARVIDGDTLEIAGRRVRLEGIDAPEIKQACELKDGQTWPAGKIAATTLERWVRNRTVTCTGSAEDSHGRFLAHCVADGVDLNAEMVQKGLAWAFLKYSQTYVFDEREARRVGQGVWSARCETAWDFRANRWSKAAPAAPSGCAIKGNITRKGRIYHMPWSEWYNRTRIEPERGERWFCNEREAQLAGWRPAQVR